MYAAGNTNFLFVNLTINHSEENLDSSRSKSFFWGGDYIYIYIYIYIYMERERERPSCASLILVRDYSFILRA